MIARIRKFIPSFILNRYHFFLAFLGAIFYWFPSSKIIVIGITGTNGKSTVVELSSKILEEAGFKVASISSIRFKIGEKEWRNELKMTMPGRFKIQGFLRQAVNTGCEYVVLEVTSEGIKQHRHRFIDFDVAVFTNLTPEHIESHGSFKKYRKAKGELFRKIKKTLIVNLDDENTEYFLQFPADEKYGFRIKNHELRTMNYDNVKLIEVHTITLKENSSSFMIHDLLFNLHLPGKFNVYNALAAICVGLSQGVNLEIIKKAIEKVEGIPGRMEIIIKEPFTAIVDYAHTPDALRKVYKTIKESRNCKRQESKVICILGAAGGGRDKWKRPELGKIAAEYCDQIILTNEDPYNENPKVIINQISDGISVYQRTHQRISASINTILSKIPERFSLFPLEKLS